MYLHDEDSANTIFAEEQRYEKEVAETKRKILGLHSAEVKQQLWKHYLHIEPLPEDNNVY